MRYLASKLFERGNFRRRKGEQFDQLIDRANGVLTLPMPILPKAVVDIAPARMPGGLRRSG